VPVRKRIAEENLLRYNGMLIGVFELLADARAQISSVNGYIDALRDFWLARAELDRALIGPADASAIPTATPMPAQAGAAAPH
jgi:outer membrane protein TolC